jgi:uncharacterized protein (TIGR02145 family)
MSGKTGTIEPYVTIGTQNWQRRNLDVSTYRNGDIIPYVANNTAWANLTTGAWCWYNNDPELGKIYGKLYNWYAVNDSRGLAPEGWSIPSISNWNTLITFLGGNATAGGAIKSTSGWISNVYNTNSSNFNGLPTGYRRNNGLFYQVTKEAFWWSTDETDTTQAQYSWVQWSDTWVYTLSNSKKFGCSIRCIKD